jgi:hypothetical protein
MGFKYNVLGILNSMWTQGVRSGYRAAYWRFVWKLIRNFSNNPTKMWMGSMALATAQHFVIYAKHVADELERDCEAIEAKAAVPIAEPALVMQAAV